jgi:XTP/dITP diphosphohydrolase
MNEQKGKGGFGYDSIFYVPTHKCSSAELPRTEKNNISHRAQALKQLPILLKENFNGKL